MAEYRDRVDGDTSGYIGIQFEHIVQNFGRLLMAVLAAEENPVQVRSQLVDYEYLTVIPSCQFVR